MRILMVGAGAIGSIVGGRLARAGRDVSLVDVDPEHIRAIRERGLHVDVPDGSFTVSLPALFPGEIAGKFDIVFIAVRAYNTQSVLEGVKPHLAEAACLVSLQNGITLPLLEPHVGADRAIGTMIRMRSRRIAPGHVRTELRGELFVGHLHGRITPQLQRIHALLNGVIPTTIVENILGQLWSKLTYTCLGVFGSLADVSLRTILRGDTSGRLCVDFLGEIIAVGTSVGARFEPLAEYDPKDFHPRRPYESRLIQLRGIADQAKIDHRAGGVEYLKRGMKTEVDYTVGHVAQEAKRLGIPAPICQALVRFIHEIEDGKREFRLENYADLAAAS